MGCMMIKKVRLFSIIVCSLLSASVFAQSKIISVDRFSQVQKIVSQLKNKKQLLVALDDDDTLTMTPCYPYSVGSTPKTACQYLGSPYWFNWQASMKKNNPHRIWNTFSQLVAENNLIFNMSKMPLDDAGIPPFLNYVHDQGAHILVITARGYSMLGATETQFNQDHILPVIEQSAIHTPSGHISFPGYYLPTPWNNKPVRRIAYLHGILYLAGLNKGVMLQQFLEKTNQTNDVKTIVFVDDTLQNVKDVAAAFAKDPNVNVISIHFLRLAKQKEAFIKGKNAKKFQAIATQQWRSILANLRKNISELAF